MDREKAILAISVIEKRYPPFDDDAYLDRFKTSDPESTLDYIEFEAEVKYLKGNIKMDRDDPLFLKVKREY